MIVVDPKVLAYLYFPGEFSDVTDPKRAVGLNTRSA
jgi:hypothetical protein